MSPDGVTPTLLRGAVAPLEVEEEGGAQRVAALALHQRVAAPHEETPPAEAAATPAAVQHEEEMPATEAAAIHVGVTQAVLEESAFLPCHLYTMHDYLLLYKLIAEMTPQQLSRLLYHDPLTSAFVGFPDFSTMP